MSFTRALPLVFLLIGGLGCSVLNSRHFDEEVRASAGTYYLPASRLEVTLKRDDDEVFLEVGQPTTVADVNAGPLTLEYNASAFSHDIITVTLTSQGLLTKVEVDVEDKLDEIIVRLAEAARMLFAPTPAGAVAEVLATFSVDPANQKSVNRVNKQVGHIVADIKEAWARELKLISKRKTRAEERLTFASSAAEDLRRATADELKLKRAQKALTDRPPKLVVTRIAGDKPEDVTNVVGSRRSRNSKGVCYRRLQAFQVDFPSRELLHSSRIDILPTGEIQCIDLTRAVFVQKVTTLDFDNGVLTGVTINKPSEVLAGIEIPIEIAKTLIELPTDLVQFKIDQTQSETTLLDEKLKLLQKRQEFLQAQIDAELPLP